MEESKEEWKGYLIVRCGRFWKVLNVHHYIGGSFTMLDKARAYIDAITADKNHKEFKRKLKEIRKEPNIAKRTREYKKLCQTHKSL